MNPEKGLWTELCTHTMKRRVNLCEFPRVYGSFKENCNKKVDRAYSKHILF